MIRKLRIKFVAIIMAIVVVMLGMMCSLIIHITRENLDSEATRALQQAASTPALVPDRRENSISLPYFVITADLRGNFLVTGNINPELYSQSQLKSFWDTAWAGTERSGQLAEYDLRYLCVGTSCIFVDTSGQQATLDELAKSCAVVAAVSFFGFLGVSILLARWAVKPVQTAWEQQRQFVADASHELKTPLSVILTNAELLSEPGYDDDSRTQFSNSILAMSQQMRGLVESLLQLARADCGQSVAETEILDYSRLVEDALLPFEPLYFEQGLTLESQITPGLWLRGNSRSLAQVVDILLDNGLKYAAPGSTVTLELRRYGRSQCLLQVSSYGTPLTAQQCRDIFHRFYRVDKARSMNRSYGLGLSIAQRIVTDHQGKIWAESKNGANHFFVLLATQ